VVALQGLDLTVKTGELMAIVGNSGSGKSTLLNIIGGLDLPSAGRIEVAGLDLTKFRDADFIRFRRETAGFVWQNVARNLVPYLSALQNVEVPMSIAGAADRRRRARELLELVGLSHRMHARLGEMSGGEQQRAAIAIGMANIPKLLLADEPTGNMDSVAAETVYQAFRTMNQQYGVTVIIVTHDRRISRAVDRVVAIRDGRTSSELIRRYTVETAGGPGSSTLASIDGAGPPDTHEELAVLDRAGRLQIPREYLDALGLSRSRKVKVSMDGDRIILEPPAESPAHKQPAEPPAGRQPAERPGAEGPLEEKKEGEPS